MPDRDVDVRLMPNAARPAGHQRVNAVRAERAMPDRAE